MLKGISPLISPELLKTLAAMGHGDEIIFSDAHFPAYSMKIPVLRADGVSVPELLAAVLPLFELDAYVDHPAVMMAPVEGDTLDDTLMAKIHQLIDPVKIEHINRFDFYTRAAGAFAVVVTGETAKYGNLLLKKGVIQVN